MQRIAPDTKKLNTFLILALMSPEDTLIKGCGRDKNKTISSLKLKSVLYSSIFSPDNSTNPFTELYYWVTLQLIFWAVRNFEKTVHGSGNLRTEKLLKKLKFRQMSLVSKNPQNLKSSKTQHKNVSWYTVFCWPGMFHYGKHSCIFSEEVSILWNPVGYSAITFYLFFWCE